MMSVRSTTDTWPRPPKGERNGAGRHGAAGLIRGYQGRALSMFDAVTVLVSWRLRMLIWTYDHHFDVVRAEVWRDA
jgi:hypothetical protein